MNLFNLSKKWSSTKETVNWMIEKKLLPGEKYCNRHKKSFQLYISEDDRMGRFHCRSRKNGGYDHRVSITENTFFENVKIGPTKSMILLYAFANRLDYTNAIRESSIDGNVTSSSTVCDWYNYCREVCTISLDSKYAREGKIGGPGHVIEVDESKFGKRKYERGRVREGTWVLGMIDSTSKDYRLEICPDNKRDANTLTQLIEKHVEKGSVIHTDLWKGYDSLQNLGYEHLTVNHSEHFRDPDTWCDTQLVESMWRPLKARLNRGGVPKHTFADHLCEYLWRMDVKKEEKDPFEQLINDIASQFPV